MAEKIQKTHKQIVFDGCVSGIAALPEAKRIEVMQGLINAFLDGQLCDDREPMVIIPGHEDPSFKMLVKAKDVEAIMALRNSVRIH